MVVIQKLKILIGVPTHTPDIRFTESLPRFIKECEVDYDIDLFEVKGLELVQAQNAIASYFINFSDCDYLLILEDDHWGHEKKMLDDMVLFNKDVTSINYYSRHFPYVNCIMRNLYMDNPDARFGGLFYTDGWHKADMSGYAMMLIKRGVFDKLQKPYFKINIGGEKSYATDIYFSDTLTAAGIEIWGCFDYILPHRDITKENRMQKLQEGMIERRKNQVLKMVQRRKVKV